VIRAAHFLCALAVVLLGGIQGLSGQSSGPGEYDVKASFIYNFTKFIEWPASTFPDAKAPITISVLGENPFGTTLDEIVRGNTINSRTLVIRRIRKLEEIKGSQVLFISGSEDKRLPEILSSVKDTDVLVIGEAEGFANHGGTIQFFLEQGKVRFSINIDAIQRTHLSVSAKLLALAKIVHDGSRP